MTKSSKNKLIPISQIAIQNSNIENLYNKVVRYVDHARGTIHRTIDTEMVKAYWLIGRDAVEEEQNGQERALYGKFILKNLSERLSKKYGRGFSVDTLEKVRKFYLTYSSHIAHVEKSATPSRISEMPVFSSNLSWSHYELLMRVSRVSARQFYEVEAQKNNWAVRELRRQIGSLLFDRLAKSKDKTGLLKLSYKGQEVNKPEDAIKDPMILEFLNLPESHRLIESKLEEALYNDLQKFLLELGKGFAFVARQKRLTLDGQHFYADLVFYSIPLKAYIIVDVKTTELTHADLGQIMLYVNYFDKEVRVEGDNPTIGIVLCTKKNNKMVEYCLGENAKQIFASTYQFHLPTVEELESELKKEIEQFKLLEQSNDNEKL